MVTAPPPPGPRSDRPAHVADLLRLLTREPGRPRLTWYGDDGERVELSGAVLENWVNKTTNLLVEEFDAGPGARVVLDLPVHWRTIVWALAAWRVGATVVLVAAEEDRTTDEGTTRPDVVVTTRPGSWHGTRAELVAVSLPALARRFDGDLPAGAIDAASAVMTYGDQVGWVPVVDLRSTAVETVSGSLLRHDELVRPSRGGGRVLLESPDPGAPVERASDVLVAAVGTWCAEGSVVLVSAAAGDALVASPDRARRLVDGEGVTDLPERFRAGDTA
ncbi:TIGR03089 family protein [Cellulosimicrobium protaetiae]|uniref:TIGR03089 family protein n=1 Tax=Cellulosimicrobium protaetiae TaxID=2587808 RepID=A0A6M5UFZ4_9MICO|nr:TIGR03089 family protein [Cellulosimicrobium protaetiae]QJW36113.1 TIGR03089 family protein [Cellulosimicrobium protaetiae]